MGRHLGLMLCGAVCLLGGVAWTAAHAADDDDPWASGNWGDDVPTVPPPSTDPPRSGGRPTIPPTTPTNPVTPVNPTTPVDNSRLGIRNEPSDEAAAQVFDQSRVQTYEITVNAADLASIDRNPSAEQKIRGSLKFQGKTYSPIAFRYKGSIGAFMAPCTNSGLINLGGSKVGKCSVKLEFDEYDSKLRFFGMKKINLHSMGHDPSMMKERLGYSLYRDMGIAAPRSMHARVVINGKLEGLFQAVEQVDKTFNRTRFEEGGEGNLYKEVWPVYDSSDTYRKALETNEDAGNVARIVRFKQSIDRGANYSSQFLDLRYMMRYIAVDRLILNDDGIMHWYCAGQQGANERRPQGNHNYYWYEAATTDRFWLIPWDLDSSFNDDGSDFTHVGTKWNQNDLLCICMPVGGVPQRAPSCDPLTKQLASFRTDYDNAVNEFVRGPFSAQGVNSKLDAWSAQIGSFVSEAAGVRSAPSANTWRNSVNSLRSVINDSRNNRGYDY